MRLINNIVSFAKKYKILILICIIVYVSFYYLNIKEGFNATSCTQFANCAECVNGKVIDTSSPCYWSSDKKKCGSFNDAGYSRQCYPDSEPGPDPEPIPEPEPIPGPGPVPVPTPSPICKECPKLTLLKTPTFITKQ